MCKTYYYFSVFIAENQGFEGSERDLGSSSLPGCTWRATAMRSNAWAPWGAGLLGCLCATLTAGLDLRGPAPSKPVLPHPPSIDNQTRPGSRVCGKNGVSVGTNRSRPPA